MIARTTRILLWLASIVAVCGFLMLAAHRLEAANPAGPAERALLDHADRLANGGALYRAPDSPFAIPMMPGMPLLVSWLVAVFGPGLWEARLVTALAALTVAGLVLVIVRAETKSGILGMVSAGILLAGIAVFTLREGAASPEPLALALGLGGLYALRFLCGHAAAVLAALLISASFFVHPLAVGFFAAGIAYLAPDRKRSCLAFVAGAAIFCGGGYVLLSARLGEWFNFNAWDGPLAAMRFRPLILLHAIGDELLGRLGVLTFSAVLAFALPTRPWRGPSGIWMWSALAVGAIALAATQNARISPQDLLPALVCLVIVGPISAQRVTQHLAAWPGSNRINGQGVVMVALVLQYVMLLAGASAALMPPPV